MQIIKYKAFFILVSIALVAVSLGLLSTLGIKKGIDFTGGSVIDITYTGNVPT
jgi:preprotein translocase subunit SecF